jgi:putative FmdB family regulatory protein
MPTYDYICLDCRKRFDVFLTYQEYGVKPVVCTHCQSGNIRRRPPRVRIMKGDEARLAQMADPSMLDGLDDDPKALGRMMRKMGQEMGEALPPQFDEVVGRLEAGQSPEEIGNAVPDWGGEGGHDHSEHANHTGHDHALED